MKAPIIWFALLFWSICLEGLGRRYVPSVPSIVFYLLKDVILLLGFFRFRPPPVVRQTAARLFKGFEVFWIAGFGWTVLEIFNPEQQNKVLGIIGLRAYWLWWMAPVVLAGVLMNPRYKRGAIYVMVATVLLVSALASVQFASPPSAAVNVYSVVDGEEVSGEMATVSATGRARVSSTFSYLSGFVAFSISIPSLLLSIGLGAKDRTVRNYVLGATLAGASTLPMSGSRGSLVLGLGVLLVIAWSAGLFFTAMGRRVIIGGVAGAILAVTAFPDAFIGVQSRFAEAADTDTRILKAAAVFPPVSMMTIDYPGLGLGTGMMQNARASMQVPTPAYEAEGEPDRYLIELGPPGAILIFLVKVGLMVALFRAYAILKTAGRRAGAGAALSYALLTFAGNLTFDHIWQALFFVGCGFILTEVVEVVTSEQAVLAAAAPVSKLPRIAVASPR